MIERQSLDLPAGTLETDERNIRLRFTDRRRTAAALEELVLRDTPAAGTIRLGDVARISETFVDEEMQTLLDGQRAALLGIRRDAASDALRVFADIEEFLAAEQSRLPDSVRFTFTDNITALIADRLEMLLTNAAQGFVLACLVLWAFFSIRFSLLVAAGSAAPHAARRHFRHKCARLHHQHDVNGGLVDLARPVDRFLHRDQ